VTRFVYNKRGVYMSALGYIFLTIDRESQVVLAEQQKAIEAYGKSMGLGVEEFFIEQGVSLKVPFRDRKEAARLLAGAQSGDILITMKAEWVLGSAKEAVRLIRRLKKDSISLYCIDLKEDISLPAERKLMVSEGGSSLILAVLSALAICDGSKHGESIKATKRYQKREGKYLGGPVPFGWQVDGEYLVQDLRQQQIIREMNKLRSDRWSYREIAAKLQDRFKVQLSHEGIRRILASNIQKKEEERKRDLSYKSKKNPDLTAHHAPLKVKK
jgi:DNA invertase Pin-like site-specific DNA recombinase